MCVKGWPFLTSRVTSSSNSSFFSSESLTPCRLSDLRRVTAASAISHCKYTYLCCKAFYPYSYYKHTEANQTYGKQLIHIYRIPWYNPLLCKVYTLYYRLLHHSRTNSLLCIVLPCGNLFHSGNYL